MAARFPALVNAAEALLEVAEAARDWHDEHCGCEGEACKIGDMLARLDKELGDG